MELLAAAVRVDVAHIGEPIIVAARHGSRLSSANKWSFGANTSVAYRNRSSQPDLPGTMAAILLEVAAEFGVHISADQLLACDLM